MKKISDSPSVKDLSWQQKLWFGAGTFFYSLGPLLLYACLPAFFMTVGMALMRGRTAENIIAASGNFYYALGIIFTVVLLHRRSKKRGSSLCEDVTLEYRELDRTRLLYLIGMGFGFGFFFAALLTVIPFPELLMESYQSSSRHVSQGNDQILALISTVLLAPVAEEIVFRGFMLNRLLSRFSEQTSVWITSVIFALCHVSILWVVYALLMGLLLAKVSIDEDNIAYSIALHIGFNASVLPIWLINRSERLSEILFANHVLVAAYGAIALFAAVTCYKNYMKEMKKW